MSFIVQRSSNEADIGAFKHTASIKVPSNIVSRSLKNTDADYKNNTEVSVFQYVFEIRSISISI